MTVNSILSLFFVVVLVLTLLFSLSNSNAQELSAILSRHRLKAFILLLQNWEALIQIYYIRKSNCLAMLR